MSKSTVKVWDVMLTPVLLAYLEGLAVWLGWSSEFELRNRILRLFDPPHQMMSSLQLRVEAQLWEFGAAIAEATDLVKSYFPEFLQGWNNLFPILLFQVVPPLAEKQHSGFL